MKKILLISLGSRGDCEPFVGIGEMLRAKGEKVVCSFPEQYRSIAEENGFEFHSLGSEFLNLINSEDGKVALSGKGFAKFIATIKIGKDSMKIQNELLRRQLAIMEELKPDIIIRHSKVLAALPYSLVNGAKSIFLALQPGLFHELEDIPSIGFDFLPPKWSYKLMRFAVTKSISMAVNQCFKGKISKKQIKSALLEEPAIYGVSAALFPQPANWDKAKTLVAGFWDREKASNYTPDAQLAAFIQQHPKILLLTFGSMTNSNPRATSELFIDILQELGIPAIINTSGGGLIEPESYNTELITFTQSIPYDWVFPQVYATIHHGGAGTVHSSLRAGCATMAIPHIADQPLMNRLINKNGTGPLGPAIGKLNKQQLKQQIEDLFTNVGYKAQAQNIAAKMNAENFSEELYEFVVG